MKFVRLSLVGWIGRLNWLVGINLSLRAIDALRGGTDGKWMVKCPFLFLSSPFDIPYMHSNSKNPIFQKVPKATL